MEKVLENIKNIDGAKMPLKVDATVWQWVVHNQVNLTDGKQRRR
jgi:hypothetical protein